MYRLLFLVLIGWVYADYGVSIVPTPVFLTSDIWSYFDTTLKKNKFWLVEPLEFVAPVGTVFDIISDRKDSLWNTVYQVSPDVRRYKSKNLFIDARFVQRQSSKPASRIIILPSKLQIIKNMSALVWTPYIWWWSRWYAIPQMLTRYPVGDISRADRAYRQLAWVDCGGLLHTATQGYTPKSTKQLISYGNPVSIAWRTRDQIIDMIKPLDIIVWPGHVIIIASQTYTIESTIDANLKKPGNQWGVVVRKLSTVLDEILISRKKIPVDNIWDSKNSFVIRRRYPL